jgi:hypothetical protein
LSRMLYTILLKSPASTLEHMKTMFQFVVICKMVSMFCIIYGAKEMAVRKCQVWAVSRMWKNSPSHFCDCITRAIWCQARCCCEGEKYLLYVSKDEL